MADGPVQSRSDGMGDEALNTATGRGWDEWFTLLDAAGAADWTHPQIVRWLAEEHAVPAWWCQGVTVGFEQARGLRLPGQRQDGSFEVSASRTLPLGQQDALTVVIEAVSLGLGTTPQSESRAVNYLTARWALHGRETLLATANPAKAGRTSVSLAHQRLAESVDVAPAKAALQAWLAAAASIAAKRLG